MDQGQVRIGLGLDRANAGISDGVRVEVKFGEDVAAEGVGNQYLIVSSKADLVRGLLPHILAVMALDGAQPHISGHTSLFGVPAACAHVAYRLSAAKLTEAGVLALVPGHS